MGRAVAAPAALAARLRAAGCVYAEDEAAVLLGAATDERDLAAMVERRVAGEPLELVVGWAAFCGHRVTVVPGVFVPRRRSEFLVDCAVEAAPAEAVVVDLCCGTGAIGLAVAHRTHPREVHAADLAEAAVECARGNLASLPGEVHQGDLYDALPPRLRGRVDLLVVNAPYVPTGELHLLPPEARDHEPPEALDGGADGVDLHRRVASGAPAWLSSRGSLLVETSARQASLTAAAVEAAGLAARVRHDEARAATVVAGVRP